ncbi:hypothetical protein [Selenihalanaerobacter shriftii]|nr:hypothetical protein [Selenihalanaerobacter shriftii]
MVMIFIFLESLIFFDIKEVKKVAKMKEESIYYQLNLIRRGKMSNY